jgi:5-methylcytosine-specific restriction endonuclease McrA
MAKKYYWNNPQLARARVRAYYRCHKEKVLEYQRRYYQLNKERIKSENRKYHWAHKAIENNRTKLWHQNHPERSRALKSFAKAKRRALEYGSRTNTYQVREFMLATKQKKFVQCHWCQKTIPGMEVYFDHVIPLRRGGPHTAENLCACCKSCNSRKKDKMPSAWNVDGQTFLTI